MCHKTVVSYNTFITSYSRSGDVEEAWDLLSEMRLYGFGPTQYTLSGLLSCESLNFRQGLQLHALSIKNGLFYADAFIGTALLGLFGRYGFLDEAVLTFEHMPQKSLVTWNSMLSLLAHNGFVNDCKLMFLDLIRTGATLSECSFLGILPTLDDLECVEQIHCLVVKYGFNCEINTVNSLISMYAKCKGIFLAQKLFEQLPVQNVISWNIMIDAFAKSGTPQMALELFPIMSSRGMMPSQGTFVAVISTCTSLKISAYGECVHAKVIRSSFESDVSVGTALVDFYAKCDKLVEAHNCFDHIKEKNMVSWNVLILGYSNICASTSVLLFHQMLQLGYRPNEFSFSAILKSALVSQPGQFHGLIIRMGYESYEYVLSSLIASYTRNGLINDALTFVKAFDNPLPVVPCNIIAGVYNRTCQYYETVKFLSLLENPDVVSWNIVIAACARSNNYNFVFELFKHMHSARIHADNYTFTSLLCVCTKLCSLSLGSSVHGLIIKTSFDNCDTLLCNVLIDMYGKCGSIDSSVKIFEEMADKNIITWTALITALGLNGFAHEALEKFQEMELIGLKPDTVAFSAVLAAFRHGGFVREGMEIFRRMKTSYGILPELNHYHCIVDLLAKNGHTVEAEKIIASMPFPPNAYIWRSFLEGYKTATENKLHTHEQQLNRKPMVVTFLAYSKDQILRILQERLSEFLYTALQHQTLELCARKAQLLEKYVKSFLFAGVQ
ncbi:hypothetical protein L6164_029888 [Bauhinia variegata]|uniref:Uncharacterized protein n=1 Tax=Bauhinia variegata TaxID=167791 RepID=A0ACB9LB32_BAUVA|nr:hypothetical protein L6164_029888 [Bauhinia variegata]